MHLEALEEASKAIRTARENEKSPKPQSNLTIHEALKQIKQKTKHIDPIDSKRRCRHLKTGFFCQLCACEKLPKDVIANAVNYVKPTRQDDNAVGLKVLRDAYKFPKSPKSPGN